MCNWSRATVCATLRVAISSFFIVNTTFKQCTGASSPLDVGGIRAWSTSPNTFLIVCSYHSATGTWNYLNTSPNQKPYLSSCSLVSFKQLLWILLSTNLGRLICTLEISTFLRSRKKDLMHYIKQQLWKFLSTLVYPLRVGSCVNPHDISRVVVNHSKEGQVRFWDIK